MSARRGYNLSEVAKIENITRRGALYWVRVHDVDCYRTSTGRIFFTEDQLAAFQERRQATLRRLNRKQHRTQSDSSLN
jgi:hypothetical protein